MFRTISEAQRARELIVDKSGPSIDAWQAAIDCGMDMGQLELLIGSRFVECCNAP